MKDHWLALAIGNSRLHWSLFEGQQQLRVWHQPLSEFKGFSVQVPQDWSEWRLFLPWTKDLDESLEHGFDEPELWIASVVPELSAMWSAYPNGKTLNVQDVPLQNSYAGLGIDRAIALWSAGQTYGWPCLVVDGGTALTLTGADAKACFVGGSILPGLALQSRLLVQSTAALPPIKLPGSLPVRWATETVAAIQSGILYTVVAGLDDSICQWLTIFPDSQIIFTGGDAELLCGYLQDWLSQTNRTSAPYSYTIDPHLIFTGIKQLRSKSR